MAAVWAQGAKFRFALQQEEASEELSLRLTKFIQDLGKSDIIAPHFDKHALDLWSLEVIDRHWKLTSSDTNFHVSREVLAAIKNLRSMFIITPVDKNPQSLAFMCPKAYFDRLEAHMSSPTYERANETPLEVLSAHEAFNCEFGVAHTPVLPYVYSIVKLHKDPSRPADRFIAGHSALNRFIPEESREGSLDSIPLSQFLQASQSSQRSEAKRRQLLRQKPDTSLSKVGRKLSNFLNSIIDVLLQQDEINILKGGPRKIWILRDIAEAQRLFANCTNIHTADFSTMYTNLPINESLLDVGNMVEMALMFLCEHVFNTDASNFSKIVFHDTPAKNKKEKKQFHCSWSLASAEHPPTAFGAWNIHFAMKALKFIMNNSYYVNVFGIFRQKIGVGMGCEPSAPAANLALAAREMKWVSSLDVRKLPHHGKFLSYGRYIDDLASSVPLIQKSGKPGIDFPDYYGMDIVITGSTKDQERVDFLSYTFHRNHPEKMRISLKDKQTTFPILLIRYPSDTSTVNEECKIGCVVGGLVTISRVIDTPFYYRRELDRFFDKLHQRRFTSRTLLQGILKYVHRNVLPQFKAYMLSNYFRPIIDKWPFHTSVAGKQFVDDYIRRHDLHLDVPYAWRQRIEEIQYVNSIKTSQEKYGFVRRTKGFTPPLDWFPILTGANEKHFPHLQPPSSSSSQEPNENSSHNQERNESPESPNQPRVFKLPPHVPGSHYYVSPSPPRQRARAVSPSRDCSNSRHRSPPQSEFDSTARPRSYTGSQNACFQTEDMPSSRRSSPVTHQRPFPLPNFPSNSHQGSGLNQSPRSYAEICSESPERSESNFINMELTPSSSFQSCQSCSSSI